MRRIVLKESHPPYTVTLGEGIVGDEPLILEQDGQAVAFDSYFRGIVNEVLPLSRQVLERATLLRARYGFRTPDAIHLAAAIDGGCDLFLTNDSQLARCQEITVEAV